MTDKITYDANGDVAQIEKAPNRVFVEFTRTLNLGDFNSAKASVNMEVAIDLDSSQEDIEREVKNSFLIAKSAVFNQLGLEATVTPEGFVRETLERAGLSGVEVEPAEVQRAVEQAANTSRPATKTEDKAAAIDDLLAAINAEWDDHGPRGWFDQRDRKRTPKAPDFKARRNNKTIAENVAVWIDKRDDVKKALAEVGR